MYHMSTVYVHLVGCYVADYQNCVKVRAQSEHVHIIASWALVLG